LKSPTLPSNIFEFRRSLPFGQNAGSRTVVVVSTEVGAAVGVAPAVVAGVAPAVVAGVAAGVVVVPNI
jgi:hypothetical protein